MKAKITKRLVDALKPPEKGDLFVWDTDLRRFGLRMKPSGAASYLVLYRNAGGDQRLHTFGRVGAMTPDEARKEARRLLAMVDSGGDPREAAVEAQEALTVGELCEQYLQAARAGLVTTRFGRPKRASTIAIDEGRVSRHIVPLIGSKKARDLKRADVQRMVDDVAAGRTAGEFKTKARGKAVVQGGAGTAARVAELLGGVWSWAVDRGLVDGVNPVVRIKKHRGEAKDRTLSREELKAMGKALSSLHARSPMACDAIRLIALSGMRREEACGLRWGEIDADGSCLRLRTTKTGRSTRPIGEAAVEHLRALPRFDSGFVFPSCTGVRSAELKKQIADIFDAAGLADARSHDLRRTFASTAADLGYSDATIAELLGHARRGVTERHYVRRPDAVLIAAATKTARLIADALDGREAEVVKLPQRDDA